MRTFDQVIAGFTGRSDGAIRILRPPVPHKHSRMYTNEVRGLLSHGTDNPCGCLGPRCSLPWPPWRAGATQNSLCHTS